MARTTPFSPLPVYSRYMLFLLLLFRTLGPFQALVAACNSILIPWFSGDVNTPDAAGVRGGGGQWTRVEVFVALGWSLLACFHMHTFTCSLILRWLSIYSPPTSPSPTRVSQLRSLTPTIIRLISLQIIFFILLNSTLTLFQRPLIAWVCICAQATISDGVGLWVVMGIADLKKKEIGVEKKKGTLWMWKRTLIEVVRVFGDFSSPTSAWTFVRHRSLGALLYALITMSFLLAKDESSGSTLAIREWIDHDGSVNFYKSHPSWSNEGRTKYGLNVTVPEVVIDDDVLSVVMLITSSWLPRSTQSRMKFRNSSLQLKPSARVRLTHRFIIGLPPTPHSESTFTNAIENEATKFGDMLLVPTNDRYDYLSEKVYAAFGWTNSLPEGFDYVIKTDDDIFLRTDTVLDELAALGRRKRYWRGLAYHEMPPILDASNKNAIFNYELGLFPPYTAGAMYILSSDIISLIALPPSVPRRFVKNEDQSLGIMLYPYGITPIHDYRIQQAQICENDLIAKHFSSHYAEAEGYDAVRMYKNLVEGREMCDGFVSKWCGICYPSCRGKANHWRDWGYSCDSTKGMTLTKKTDPEKILSEALVSTVHQGLNEGTVAGSKEDPWILPDLLSTRSSIFSQTEDWYLLNLVCWTTAVDTFQERHWKAIETIFVHEPRAVVIMLSTTLPTDFFASYVENGYEIYVIRVGKQEVLERKWYVGSETEEWVKSWDRWEAGPNFFSHLTDYLRYFFLYRFGGTYQDMDAPWLRSPPDPRVEFVGADMSTLSSDNEWTLDENGTYLAPGVMRFKAGWSMFKEILETRFSGKTYQTDCFNCVGPRAITSYVKENRRRLELSGLTILPREVFYPFGWQEAYKALQEFSEGNGEGVVEYVKKLGEKSWSLHLFGKVTGQLDVHDKSILSAVFDHFTLKVNPQSTSDIRTFNSHTLELVAPSEYRYRRRIDIEKTGEFSENQVWRMGSLDGRFEGKDVIFIRRPRTSIVSHGFVRLSVQRGELTISPSTAKILACSKKRKCLSGGQKVEWTLGKTNIQSVNYILGSLVYQPSEERIGGRDEEDEMNVNIVFGSEVVSKRIKIRIQN